MAAAHGPCEDTRSISAITGVRLRQLVALERGERVLVGHGGVAEARARVTDISLVVDRVVVVERGALRPVLGVRGDGSDGTPTRSVESRGQRKTVSLEKLVIALLTVDPQAGLERAVG